MKLELDLDFRELMLYRYGHDIKLPPIVSVDNIIQEFSNISNYTGIESINTYLYSAFSIQLSKQSKFSNDFNKGMTASENPIELSIYILRALYTHLYLDVISSISKFREIAKSIPSHILVNLNNYLQFESRSYYKKDPYYNMAAYVVSSVLVDLGLLEKCEFKIELEPRITAEVFFISMYNLDIDDEAGMIMANYLYEYVNTHKTDIKVTSLRIGYKDAGYRRVGKYTDLLDKLNTINLYSISKGANKTISNKNLARITSVILDVEL